MEWIDVKFSDFLKERKGRYKPNDEAIKGLKRIEKIDFSGQIYISDKPSKTDMILVKDGDLVISGINVEKGAMNIFHGNEDVVATIHYSSYTYDTNVIELEFLKHFLKSKKFKDVLKEQVPGGIKTEIKPKHLLPLQIQIPKSLDDQKKIVEHLDQLYDKLNDSSTEITHQLDLIKNLRQAFLREAMQGILVSNETSDNKTGADLLAEIQAEKAQLVKEKKIKKPKPLAPITEDEIPFDIPENWTWCRLGELADLITKGSSPKWQGVKYVDSYEEGILFVTSKNIDYYNVDLSNATYVTSNFNEIEPRSILQKGDLLTNIVGGSIGRTAIYNEDFIANINQAVCLIRLNEIINKLFMLNLFNSDYIVSEMFKNQFSPGRANLSMSNIENFAIPLPPLEIQERIVAKLDELMSYCDALEEQVKQSQQTNELLLQQVLREALGA
ncbi:restriction endonuclease subunit S [Empedobacter falsenii]